MAGIYIHIPFCKKACHYCNFHFSTNTQNKDDIINAIVQEIKLQKLYINEPVKTIYFGGGTPSILTAKELEKIIDVIHQNFSVATTVEQTLEANPDDITKGKILELKNLNFNRLSIGIQSFIEADLQWMNRAHNAVQAKNSVFLAKENGINNLSIDLIYGTPNLTNQEWLSNIETANELGIQHLSCYALTVEPNTALQKMILQKRKEHVDENKAVDQFELLMERSAALGFEHYEISNFAKPSFRSQHNSSYWNGVPYLGIGPSAHSYNGKERQWNVANNALYVKSLIANTVPFEIETLTEKQKANETIMTNLRLAEGLDIIKIKNVDIVKKAQKFIAQKLIIHENGFLKLTNAGKLRADGIAAELFL
jgi:oxygen-independent coproporphyrinogen III oxidase